MCLLSIWIVLRRWRTDYLTYIGGRIKDTETYKYFVWLILGEAAS